MSIINLKEMAKLAINKSVLKEYQNNGERVVYLNNGDEFQICLFNPENFVIGAEISVNGKKESGLIVIRPGERVWVERPLNTQRKYRFETYEVEDSPEAAKAITNNGMISIRFFKESQEIHLPDNWWRSVSTPYVDYLNQGITVDYLNQGITTCINSICDCQNTLLNAKLDYPTTDSIQTQFDTIGYNTSSIETGRISTGSHSDQTFSYTNIDFASWPYREEGFHILPMSRKPYTNSDLQKVYCVECGRKLNPKYKFCPYCGTKCE